MNKNGTAYTYGAKPHAVTAVGATNYAYDANGNMTNRGGQVLTWDVENRPVSISENGTTSTFVYDGDGKRVKKTEGGQKIIYVNGYYEKNITISEVTTNYLHGGRLVAQKKGTNLQYLHQDHLTGTSLSSDNSGSLVSTIKYFPFGATRSGNVNTDIKFTGQRLDNTGLYYYNARYYDPQIGRFISADTIVPKPSNPQTLNRYAYCLNNPLKYIDPSGHYGHDLWCDVPWTWGTESDGDGSETNMSFVMGFRQGFDDKSKQFTLEFWEGVRAVSKYVTNCKSSTIHVDIQWDDLNLDIGPRVADYENYLLTTDKTNLNIIAFSKGVAVASTALYNIAMKSADAGQPMMPYNRIATFNAIEAPNSILGNLLIGWDGKLLDYLPNLVQKYVSPNIQMRNFYNTSSMGAIQSTFPKGWSSVSMKGAYCSPLRQGLN